MNNSNLPIGNNVCKSYLTSVSVRAVIFAMTKQIAFAREQTDNSVNTAYLVSRSKKSFSFSTREISLQKQAHLQLFVFFRFVFPCFIFREEVSQGRPHCRATLYNNRFSRRISFRIIRNCGRYRENSVTTNERFPHQMKLFTNCTATLWRLSVSAISVHT